MSRTHAPLLIGMAVVLLASACLVAQPIAPAAPTPVFAKTEAGKSPVSTLVFTATRLNPTQTPSITMTLFPSITPLPTATATATETPVGFVSSATPAPPTSVLTPTPESTDIDEGYTDDWGSDTRCTLITKSPANWTVVPSISKYKVSWTLLNSGHKNWQADGMILTYLSGAKLTPENKTTLLKDVRVGQTIRPVINIYPPKAPGNYKSVWGLRLNKTGHVFCTFTIKITVQ